MDTPSATQSQNPEVNQNVSVPAQEKKTTKNFVVMLSVSILLLAVGFAGGWFFERRNTSNDDQDTITSSESTSLTSTTISSSDTTSTSSSSARDSETETTRISTVDKEISEVIEEIYPLIEVDHLYYPNLDGVTFLSKNIDIEVITDGSGEELFSISTEYVDDLGREYSLLFTTAGTGGLCTERMFTHSTAEIDEINICEQPGEDEIMRGIVSISDNIQMIVMIDAVVTDEEIIAFLDSLEMYPQVSN